MDAVFHKLSELSGAPADHVKLITCLLLSYPLALPLTRLPHHLPWLKHAYNILVSWLFLVPILRIKYGFIQLLLTSLVTYAIAYHVKSRKMPWIVFGVEMAHLTINHLYRHFGNIGLDIIEITAMQMVLCMNLTTFAWNVHDGRRDEKDLDQEQLAVRIKEMPDLLSFLGYCFYFPGVLVGPSSTYAAYSRFISGELFSSRKGKEPERSSPHVPRGRTKAAMRELCLGILFIALYSLLSSKYDYHTLVGEVSSQANIGGFLRRLLFVNVAGLVTRFKYYGIWSLSNGACVLSGLAYSGVDPSTGETRWERCRNVSVAGVEFARNWKEVLDAWNMNTNIWLRNCVYKRLAKEGRKPGFKSTMATFFTSAFWHGIEPGYYLTFLLAGFMQTAARRLRSHLRPFFYPYASPFSSHPAPRRLSQHWYDLLSILLTQLTLNYTVAPFILLDVRPSLEAWRSLWWYGHLAVFAVLTAFYAGAGKVMDEWSGVARRRREEARKKGEQDKNKAVKEREVSEPPSVNPAAPVDVMEKEVEEKVNAM